MNDFSDFGGDLGGGRFVPHSRAIGVHALSEFVFCPRAGLLARESGPGDTGEEQPSLGPRLDGFHDYHEQRFTEEIHAAIGAARMWLTCLAPALLLVFIVWNVVSPFGGLVSSLPAVYVTALLWDAILVIATLVRERSVLRNAPAISVELAPKEITKINWWTLRKAGFDCVRLRDAHRDEALIGKPWRLLIKDTQWRIPVIRKHRGEPTWGPQHVVRAAAYCRLVERCEGGRAPFAILLFANSYDGVVIPNTPEHQRQLDRALEEFDRAAERSDQGQAIPPAPTDDRCRGCGWGEPVSVHVPTVLNGQTIPPLKIEGIARGEWHCACGDQFRWTPPHGDIERLRDAVR